MQRTWHKVIVIWIVMTFGLWVSHPVASLAMNGQPDFAYVSDLQVSPDGTSLALLDRSRIWIVDVNKGEILRTIDRDGTNDGNNPPRWIYMSWNPDSTHLALEAESGAIGIWDAITGKLDGLLDGAIALGPVKWNRQNQIAVAEGATISLWDGTTFAKSGDLIDNALSGLVYDFDWNSDGTRCVATTAAGGLRIWDTTTKQIVRRVDTDFPPLDVDWSSTLNTIAILGRHNGRGQILDAQTGEPLFDLQTPDHASLLRISYSFDGSKIAADISDGIWIWDGQTGEVLKRVGTGNVVGAFAWTPNGDIFYPDNQGGLMLNDKPFPITANHPLS